MTQTVQNTQPESTMYIPPTVLGMVLDTSNRSFQDAMKGITGAFLRMIGDHPHAFSTFLIASCDGTAYPIPVTAKTFEKQWKEVPWGKTPDIVAGLQAMANVMGEYTKPDVPTPAFRTLLLTANPPGNTTAFHAAITKLGRVEIGVLGEEVAQQQALTGYHDATGYDTQATVTRIYSGETYEYWAKSLYYSLN